MSDLPIVSVVIPTFRRPQALDVALRSVFAQTGVDFAQVEIVVIDNDPARSATPTVTALAVRAPCPLRLRHEPDPGVANARNLGVRASRAPLIAFLDDDQAAEPGWLAALVSAHIRLKADVVFGPVTGQAAHPRHSAYLAGFFSRLGPIEETLLDHAFGCGNCLIVRAALPTQHTPFAMERNFIGGEDDLLFAAMAETGARFGWSPDAVVAEIVPPERARLSYALSRAFAFGQGPASAAAAAHPPRPVEAGVWMARGLVQAPAFALLAMARAALGRRDWIEAMDRAARGLGKVLWFSPFKIRFYGGAA